MVCTPNFLVLIHESLHVNFIGKVKETKDTKEKKSSDKKDKGDGKEKSEAKVKDGKKSSEEKKEARYLMNFFICTRHKVLLIHIRVAIKLVYDFD